MPIPVTCECGKVYSAPDGSEGERLVCPACHARIPIPAVGPTIEPGPSPSRMTTPIEVMLIVIAVLSAIGVGLAMILPARDGAGNATAFQTFAICLTVALAGLAASRR